MEFKLVGFALLAASSAAASAVAFYRLNSDVSARYAQAVSRPGYRLAIQAVVGITPRKRVFATAVPDPAPAPRARVAHDVPPPELARGYVERDPSRYLPHIRRAARATNVPVALIQAVISAESAYNPYALSATGAVGLMQLMPETAARYGVKNRMDPGQNILGGARYLSDLMRLFDNNMKLTLAAYNAGEGSVIRYGRKVPPFPETVAYVPKVLGYYKRYRLA